MNINECLICYENVNVIKTVCNHLYCKDCFCKWEKECLINRINSTCPYCRKILKINSPRSKTLDIATFYWDYNEVETQNFLEIYIEKSKVYLFTLIDKFKPFSF